LGVFEGPKNATLFFRSISYMTCKIYEILTPRSNRCHLCERVLSASGAEADKNKTASSIRARRQSGYNKMRHRKHGQIQESNLVPTERTVWVAVIRNERVSSSRVRS
jgi:hypothetical protein